MLEAVRLRAREIAVEEILIADVYNQAFSASGKEEKLNSAYARAIERFEAYLAHPEEVSTHSSEQLQQLREAGVLLILEVLREAYRKGYPEEIAMDVGGSRFRRLLEEGLGSQALSAAEFRPFADAEEYRSYLNRIAENAGGFLGMSFFGWFPDAAGKEFLQRLAAKKVGLNYDQLSSKYMEQGISLVELDLEEFKRILVAEGTGQSLADLRPYDQDRIREELAKLWQPIQISVLLEAKAHLFNSGKSKAWNWKLPSTLAFHSHFDDFGIELLYEGSPLRVARVPLPATDRRLPLPVPLPHRLVPLPFLPSLLGSQHAKYIFNDHGEVLVMGQSIADKYFQEESSPGGRLWRDGGWWLVGQAATPLQYFHAGAFNRALRVSRRFGNVPEHSELDPELRAREISANLSEREENLTVHFIVTQPRGPVSSSLRQFEALLFAAIAAAREEILIVTPFFSEGKIADALVRKKKARPELRITVILPGWSDQPLPAASAWCLRRRMLGAGIEVVQWKPDPEATPYAKDAMLHWKAFTVDGRLAYSGSGNMTRRSLRTDGEAGYLTQDLSVVAELNALIRKDIQNSRALEPPRRNPLVGLGCAVLEHGLGRVLPY
ncbi:MAG: hypothetical protein HY402_03940 [Elusimicrobia bacterium]|nr:hypothetical protein [Elusimicrobiota bacterium]